MERPDHRVSVSSIDAFSPIDPQASLDIAEELMECAPELSLDPREARGIYEHR